MKGIFRISNLIFFVLLLLTSKLSCNLFHSLNSPVNLKLKALEDDDYTDYDEDDEIQHTTLLIQDKIEERMKRDYENICMVSEKFGGCELMFKMKLCDILGVDKSYIV